MRTHVWRPAVVAIGLVLLFFVARFFLVPADFGAHESDYVYRFYRLANEQEWREHPVGYRTSAGCGECHQQAEFIASSPHAPINCENCHGPALQHPQEPAILTVETGRGICLRCHAGYAYRVAGRAAIPGIDPQSHFPDQSCADCHDPHRPQQEVRP
jgi:predicted CXXCH cytochrome family protein